MRLLALVCVLLLREVSEAKLQEPPDGYYAFMQSPRGIPPRVRRPPYVQTDKECTGGGGGPDNSRSLNNLCGDLNKGFLPRNPMGQNVLGYTYPFELLKNHTLQFLSKTLPILKQDDTVPKVARYTQDVPNTLGPAHNRFKREAESTPEIKSESRGPRKFCDKGGGILCMLYNAFSGEQEPAERRDGAGPDIDAPPTPCPAKVEYATPVFARNYQGVWRYVVQIPYEGYFTQTIEVTRCLQVRCHYLDGGCLSSPRWVSLLVAEIYYPDTVLPAGSTPSRPAVVPGTPPSVQDFNNYQQYLHKRAGAELTTTSKPQHCDGVDEIGCFQVRLYYDWFLVPGSCKCWRQDYFSRYVRRKMVGPDL